MLYLLALDNTPNREVPPDKRLTLRGIVEGTQIPLAEVTKQLMKLVENALVRPKPIDFGFVYILTEKGRNQIKLQVGKKEQKKWVKLKLDKKGPSLEYGRSETKGDSR